MATGDMKIYALEAIRGDIAYSSTVAPLRLGGLSNPRIGAVTLTIPLPEEAEVKRVLLEIGLVTREYPERMRWRLWFDGIAVSREYRPKSIAALGEEGYYSKAVFDVTPIFKREVEVHKVTVSYEGSDPATVEHVGMLAIYDVPDSVVSYAFLSGALALTPGERYALSIRLRDVPSDATQASMRLVASLAQRTSTLRVYVNGVEKTRLTGFVGAEDVTIEEIPVAEEYEIGLSHEAGGGHAKLSTIILAVAKRALPDIAIEAVERSGEKLRVTLVNRGVSASEKTMLLMIIPGEAMKRLDLGPMKPGEAKTVELEAPRDRRVTLRVVWVKHGRPYHREVRV